MCGTASAGGPHLHFNKSTVPGHAPQKSGRWMSQLMRGCPGTPIDQFFVCLPIASAITILYLLFLPSNLTTFNLVSQSDCPPAQSLLGFPNNQRLDHSSRRRPRPSADLPNTSPFLHPYPLCFGPPSSDPITTSISSFVPDDTGTYKQACCHGYTKPPKPKHSSKMLCYPLGVSVASAALDRRWLVGALTSEPTLQSTVITSHIQSCHPLEPPIPSQSPSTSKFNSRPACLSCIYLLCLSL